SGSAKRFIGVVEASSLHVASTSPLCCARDAAQNSVVVHIGVRTPAGWTVFTRILSLAHSTATERANKRSPALLAAYALAPGAALMPEADDTSTMLPPFPAPRMARTACFVPRYAPSRLMAITRRHTSR